MADAIRAELTRETRSKDPNTIILIPTLEIISKLGMRKDDFIIYREGYKHTTKSGKSVLFDGSVVKYPNATFVLKKKYNDNVYFISHTLNGSVNSILEYVKSLSTGNGEKGISSVSQVNLPEFLSFYTAYYTQKYDPVYTKTPYAISSACLMNNNVCMSYKKYVNSPIPLIVVLSLTQPFVRKAIKCPIMDLSTMRGIIKDATNDNNILMAYELSGEFSEPNICQEITPDSEYYLSFEQEMIDSFKAYDFILCRYVEECNNSNEFSDLGNDPKKYAENLLYADLIQYVYKVRNPSLDPGINRMHEINLIKELASYDSVKSLFEGVIGSVRELETFYNCYAFMGLRRCLTRLEELRLDGMRCVIDMLNTRNSRVEVNGGYDGGIEMIEEKEVVEAITPDEVDYMGGRKMMAKLRGFRR